MGNGAGDIHTREGSVILQGHDTANPGRTVLCEQGRVKEEGADRLHKEYGGGSSFSNLPGGPCDRELPERKWAVCVSCARAAQGHNKVTACVCVTTNLPPTCVCVCVSLFYISPGPPTL